MKYLVVVALLGMLVMAGCVSTTGAPISGWIYTDVKGPGGVGEAPGFSKVGQATATGIICVATGDASVEAAAKSAGITNIHHVDIEYFSVLGVYGKATTTVYGE